jgi:hypothetical protein
VSARSVVPSILEMLDPYLERIEHDWSIQPEDGRQPTLPLTPDGKVNVRRLVRDAGLRETLEQHFYRKPELSGPVNALARAQGVKPIGSRALDDAVDAGVSRQMGRQADEISELRKALAEREALVEALRAKINSLEARLGLMEETGMVIRMGPVS